MDSVIDTRGLGEEDIQILKDLAGVLRDQKEAKKQRKDRRTKGIVFGTHPSNVIGTLTRTEIYEHL